MTQLALEIEEFLKGKLKGESIKIVAEIVDLMKYKEEQEIWSSIENGEIEPISEEELADIEAIKSKNEFIPMDEALSYLNEKDETFYV